MAIGEGMLGQRLGRYMVIDRLRDSLSGAVYVARDTELGRLVALKLLRGHGPADQLLRDARTMAQLVHANVVTVFDVGSVDDRVYVATELIDGLTLRNWLGAAPRSWREIVAVFAAAGNGLVAAHAVGLRCDFNIDSVIIGNDGRVRVSDIMAPEPTGGPADARADQYDFAAALHGALFGRQPTAAPPRGSGAPLALHRVLLRALRRVPEERYPSMAALLAALSPAPRNRRRLAIAALPVAAVAIVCAGGFVMQLGAHRQHCSELVGRLRGLAVDLRSRLRRAHMLRRHDIQPDRDEVRRAIREVEAERNTPAGQDEHALVDYVLGEGYRALGDNTNALAALEAAWQAGERGPNIDLALGAALGAAYESKLSELESTVQSSERAAKVHGLEQRYRDPALHHLRAALASRVGSPAYLEAQIAFHNHDFAEASARAHAALSEDQTLYEAGVLEAQAHNEIGRALLAVNQQDAGKAEFATARQVFERVLETARSDDQMWTAYAAMLSAQSNALGQGVLPPELQRPALDALHTVEQIDPTGWEPLLAETAFHQEQANNAIFMFRDPGKFVDQMLALTAVARGRGAPSDQVDVYVCLALWERAVYQGRSGIDPRPTFQQATAACERAAAATPGFDQYDSLGVVYAAQALYLADHGSDPMPAFALAEHNYRAAIAIEDWPPLHHNLGKMWAYMARYQQGHGSSPDQAIQQAQAELDRAITMDAMRGDAWAEKGLASIVRARSLRGDPQAEQRALTGASDDFSRAIELEPELVSPRLYRIQLAERDAELLLADHASPLAAAGSIQQDARFLLHNRPDDSFAHRALCHAELIAARWAIEHHQPIDRQLADATADAIRARFDDANDALAWTASAEVELMRATAASRAADTAAAVAAAAAATSYVERALAIDPTLVAAHELRDAVARLRAGLLSQP